MTHTRPRFPAHAFIPFLSVLVITACGQPGNAGVLGPDAFEKSITEEVQLIDVRTPAEYADGHIRDARNLDWTSGQLQASLTMLDKDAPVLVYCASGRRSAAARDFLLKAGFKDVTDLEGGIKAWVGDGKPVSR